MAGRTTSPPIRLKAEPTYGGQDDKSTKETEGRTYLWRAGRQVPRGDRRQNLPMAGRTTSPPIRLKAEPTYGGQDDKSTNETEGRTYLWRAGRQVHRGDRRRGLRLVASRDSSRAAPTTPHTAPAVASRVPPSPPNAATRCPRDSS